MALSQFLLPNRLIQQLQVGRDRLSPNQLASGGVNCITPFPRNAVGGGEVILSGSGSPTLESRKIGKGLKFVTSGQTFQYATNLPQNFTLLVVATVDVGGGTKQLLDDDNGSGAGRNFQFRLNANAVEFIRFNTTPSAFFATDATALTGNELNSGFVACAVSNGTTISVFANHRKTVGTTITGTPSTPTANIQIGTSKASAANGGAIIHSWIVLPFAADDSFIHQYVENPWQIWQPPPRKVFIPAAGIAFDAAANSGYQAAASTYTFNRTVTGSNTFLTVNVSLLSAGQTVTSIVDDFGGTNTQMVLEVAKSTVTSFGRIEMWRLVNPTAGTKTIQVNLSGAIASTATAASYTGVHQTSPTEGANSAQATNVGAADATVNITTVADNDWVVGAIATSDSAITANQTSRNNVTGAGGSGANEDNNGPKTPAGAVTMSYTNVDAAMTWAIAGYAIRPIAASGLGGTVFTASLLNGLSAAGKFFRNPLG